MPKMNELARVFGDMARFNQAWFIDQEWAVSGIGRMKNTAYQPKVEDGVAMIPVYGVLSRKGSDGGFFDEPEASMENIESDFMKAIANPEVKGIVLDISSPGGTVEGTARLAQVIREHKNKPVIAFTGGMMASAAYYIGSAADFLIADGSALVGSIGTIITHQDYSKRAADFGVKFTFITGGKDKALANSYEPLTETGKAYLQNIVDTAYKQFQADVKLHRGEKIDVEKVSTGRVFTANEALSLGLIDQIGHIEDALAMAKSKTEGGEMFKTLIEMKEKCADLCKEFRAEIEAELTAKHAAEFDAKVKEMEAQKALAVSDALAAEKQRVADIKAMAAPGQTVIVEKMIADGSTKEAAMVALFEDLKARPAAALQPSEADKALALLNGSAPAAPTQPANAGEGSVVKSWQAIKDDAEKAKFYAANREKILAEKK